MSADENTTTNGTQPLDCSYTTGAKVGQTSAYCLMFFVSLVGNIFIGIIVYKTKTMRKPINFLIVNMAMSDLLFPIFQFPGRLTELYAGSWLISGPLGQALCKLVAFIPNFSFCISVQSLVLIAVDRFGAVVLPLRSPLISSKLCPFFILATWIVAMAIWFPYLFASKLVKYPERLVCEMKWNETFGEFSYASQEHYTSAFFIASLFIPLLLTILYTIIYYKLKTQTVPGEQLANAGELRVKRERNVLKMSLAIVLGFAVCWLPYSIAWILSHFVWDIWSCSFQIFMEVTWFMANTNCAINPCICFIFSGNYRQGLKTLLRCC